MNEHGHNGELCEGGSGTPNRIEGANYVREGIKGAGYSSELESLGVESLDGGDGGDGVVDLSGGGCSGRTLRSEQGCGEYLGEGLYDGEERDGGEDDEGE